MLSWDYNKNAVIHDYFSTNIQSLNLVNEKQLRGLMGECCNNDYYISHLISLLVIFSSLLWQNTWKSNFWNKEFVLSYALGRFMMVEVWQHKCDISYRMMDAGVYLIFSIFTFYSFSNLILSDKGAFLVISSYIREIFLNSLHRNIQTFAP